jgi:hypothetical protein
MNYDDGWVCEGCLDAISAYGSCCCNITIPDATWTSVLTSFISCLQHSQYESKILSSSLMESLRTFPNFLWLVSQLLSLQVSQEVMDCVLICESSDSKICDPS